MATAPYTARLLTVMTTVMVACSPPSPVPDTAGGATDTGGPADGELDTGPFDAAVDGAADGVEMPDLDSIEPDQAEVGDLSDVLDALTDADTAGPDGENDTEPEIDSEPEVLLDGAADSDAEADSEVAPDVQPDTPDTGPPDPCADPDLKIQPNSLPDGSTCTTPCPAPYACTCGVCPWVQTPPMIWPRYNHRVFWTGKEVLVFGGTLTQSTKPGSWAMTGERWEPGSGKGFQEVNVLKWPPPVGPSGSPGYEVEPVDYSVNWTGKEILVLSGSFPSFRWDPVTDTSKVISVVGRPYHREELAVAAGGILFNWGYDGPDFNPGDLKGRIGLYHPDKDEWEQVPLPVDLLPAGSTSGGASCVTAWGSDVFLYGMGAIPAAPWPNGADQNKQVVVMRFHVPTRTFSYLPSPPMFAQCGGVKAVGFPAGLAALGAVEPKELPLLMTYINQLGSWKQGDSSAAFPSMFASTITWAGDRLAYARQYFPNPKKEPDPSQPPGWPIFYYAEPDLWQIPTSIGAPNDERGSARFVNGGSDFYHLGGTNAFVVYTDGQRFWLPSLPVPTAGP